MGKTINKKTIAPRWAVCISFAIILATGVFIVFDALMSLRSLALNPVAEILGILLAQLLIFYFVFYIPIGIINEYLKKKN